MSKPLLKIGPLTSLQDARSSAAVGFDLLTFSLERGSNQKLSVSLIWNMVQWLSGPEIVLELNRFSLEELKEVEDVFEYQYLSFPVEEFGPDLLELKGSLILRTSLDTPLSTLQTLLSQAPEHKVWLELDVESGKNIGEYLPVLGRTFLHETQFASQPYLFADGTQMGGYALKQEAEEEPGILDYEAIDDWVEAFREAFDED